MRFDFSATVRSLVFVGGALLLAGHLGGCSGSSPQQSSPGAVNTDGSGTSGGAGATNRPPTVSGHAATTATAAEAYRFEPVAADPDGDALSFQIQNKPDWASFDAASGRLSGTPTAADIGSYGNIRIAVTDGKATTSLAAFTLTVEALASGQATLSWLAPTQNADGTPLTNLAGYTIHYGRAAEDLTSALKVGIELTTVVIDNLSSGTWYFAMSAYNSSGIDSGRTAPVTKVI